MILLLMISFTEKGEKWKKNKKNKKHKSQVWLVNLYQCRLTPTVNSICFKFQKTYLIVWVSCSLCHGIITLTKWQK